MSGWIVNVCARALTAIRLWPDRKQRVPLPVHPGRTLVVVDMQRGFLGKVRRAERVIAAVAQEIRHAILRGDTIVLLEYSSGWTGPTDARLLKLVEHYDKALTVSKNHDDGSTAIAAQCEQLGLPTANFRLCGVNSDCCVLRTAIGLSRLYRGSRVELVDAACDTRYHFKWLEYYLSPRAWRIPRV